MPSMFVFGVYICIQTYLPSMFVKGQDSSSIFIGWWASEGLVARCENVTVVYC